MSNTLSDKEVGKLWASWTGGALDRAEKFIFERAIRPLIRKLVEERAKELYYKGVNSREGKTVVPWDYPTNGGDHFRRFYTRQALSDFSIDPETWE